MDIGGNETNLRSNICRPALEELKTIMNSFLNGRQPPWKTTSIEHHLNSWILLEMSKTCICRSTLVKLGTILIILKRWRTTSIQDDWNLNYKFVIQQSLAKLRYNILDRLKEYQHRLSQISLRRFQFCKLPTQRPSNK